MFSDFSIFGREFDIEAESPEDLERIDWPDTIRGFDFTKRAGLKVVAFAVERRSGFWYTRLNVSGPDVTWVKGVAGHLESLLKKRRSLNGLLSNAPLDMLVGCAVAALLIATLWLVLSAIDAPRQSGEWGREVEAFGTPILLLAVVIVTMSLASYLFPAFEFQIDSSPPTHVRRRALIIGAFGTFLISTLAGLVVAGLVVLL